jgi:outer membrane murein-binding lipoprotein Lpp
MRVWIGLIAVLLLAGCSGVMDALEYADLAQDAQGRNARVAELANTSFASMPDS